uniref:Calponin-homology (CH) domain-containing protein n=1 Tax=Xiphophorus maculatus TaxID=8083 RepID=A0A3B5PT05_XIPMA
MKNSGFLEPQQLFFLSPAEPAEEEEEMPATEKDLAEDAPWKKIQQNTFTRWCNEHLKGLNRRIADLQRDLSDGLKLIGLLEVLSQKKISAWCSSGS